MNHVSYQAKIFVNILILFIFFIGSIQQATAQCVPAPNPDLNNDGIVSLADLYIVTSNFGVPGADETADTNCDGKVDTTDVLFVRNAMGTVILGKVSGGVFYFGTNYPVPSATVTVVFSETGTVYNTVSDMNGQFSIENVVPKGAFVITADGGNSATGSVQGSVLAAELNPSVVVFIDQPGLGSVRGQVLFEDGTPAISALVTATFPETRRVYTTLTGTDGTYTLSQMQFDGTVIMIGFDSKTAASASFSSVVSSSFPSSTVNLVLKTPPFVNPELLNTGFTDGLNGWYSSGPVQVIDRNLYFGSQSN